MLALSRREGESILIGSDIWITLVWVGPGKVRLAIEAPREIPIKRAELCTEDELKSLVELIAKTKR